jgi:hypothetical protein
MFTVIKASGFLASPNLLPLRLVLFTLEPIRRLAPSSLRSAFVNIVNQRSRAYITIFASDARLVNRGVPSLRHLQFYGLILRHILSFLQRMLCSFYRH